MSSGRQFWRVSRTGSISTGVTAMSSGPQFWRVSVLAGLVRGWFIRWAHWRTLDNAQRYLDGAQMSSRWVQEMDVKPWKH